MFFFSFSVSHPKTEISTQISLKSKHGAVVLCLGGLGLLLLLDLEEESAVDVGQDTSEGDGGADQGIEFFVATDGQLEMAGCDTLDLEVLGSILWKT